MSDWYRSPLRSFIAAIDSLRLILDVSRLLAVTADLDLLLRRIAESATSLLGSERASIFLHDEKKGELWTKVALGESEIRIPDSTGMVGHALQINSLINTPDAYSEVKFNRDVDKATGYFTRNLLTVPMHDIDQKPIGVLQAINKIGGIFTRDDESMIAMLAAQAGVAVQRYNLQQSAVQNAELRREMDLAREVQKRLIPRNPPKLAGIECIGWTRPASITGGDCFDLWPMADDTLGIFLGDASGHGIAPAMIVSQARSLIRAMCEFQSNPQWLLSRANARLSLDIDDGRFVTAFVAKLQSDGNLQWYSAGQGPILFRKSPTADIQTLAPTCQPLGIDFTLPDEQPFTTQFDPGGILYVMSDGIFEALNPDGQLLGQKRVIDLLNAMVELPLEKQLLGIKELVYGWQTNHDGADDQTAVLVRRL